MAANEGQRGRAATKVEPRMDTHGHESFLTEERQGSKGELLYMGWNRRLTLMDTNILEDGFFATLRLCVR